jgi:uncharacterized membrane protein
MISLYYSMIVYRVSVYFVIFLAGGFFGWVVDTSYRSYMAGNFAPATLVPFFSLIFASAAVLLFALFQSRSVSFWVGVLVGTLICIALEFTCGLISQTVFHYRFWDYSAKPYNLRGFIDLEHSVYWFVLTLLYRKAVSHWVKQRAIQQIYTA